MLRKKKEEGLIKPQLRFFDIFQQGVLARGGNSGLIELRSLQIKSCGQGANFQPSGLNKIFIAKPLRVFLFA